MFHTFINLPQLMSLENAFLPFPYQFFIIGIFSVQFMSLCLVENIFVTSISKFLSSTYLSFPIQLNTSFLWDGPLLCLGASHTSICLGWLCCLMPSSVIIKTVALVASTTACAIACFIASISTIYCFCFDSSPYFLYWILPNFSHQVKYLSYIKVNTIGSFVCIFIVHLSEYHLFTCAACYIHT